MKITIAICTWNRASLLEQTLQSLVEMRTPGESVAWELLVIDNNCTDATPEVLAKFSDRLPLRIVNEPQQGHSHSRNRAVTESNGDYVIWTDDDVLVEPNWLMAYLQAFEKWPDAAFWGGEIEPRFESDPPSWLEKNWQRCAGVFAVRSLGSEAFEFDQSKLPFGANLAIRGDLQRQYAFDAKFGRVSDTSVRGFDEIDVLLQLLADGHKGYWVPDARLTHFIPSNRMTLKYVRQFYEGQGETWVLRGRPTPSSSALRAQLWKHEFGYLWQRGLGRTTSWFDHIVKASRARGQLRYLREHVAP